MSLWKHNMIGTMQVISEVGGQVRARGQPGPGGHAKDDGLSDQSNAELLQGFIQGVALAVFML